MIQARIAALKKLTEAPFDTVLDVDVVTKNREGAEVGKETRSFVPLERAADLREGLAEALRGLDHYRDALKARIVSDSAFSGADLARIDADSSESGDSDAS